MMAILIAALVGIAMALVVIVAIDLWDLWRDS